MITMKRYTIFKKAVLAFCALAMFAVQGYAQWDSQKAHLIVDWQMNAPVSTGFADKISGWGMNFEGFYDLTSRWSVGAFINFHTNHKYIGRQTIQLSPTEALTTDQQRSAYQLPFGVGTSYTLYNGRYVKPYVGVKLGTAYTRYTTYYGAGGVFDSGWGFYVSPEVGLKIYPSPYRRFGFHVAGYYNYMTNKMATLTGDVTGQSNVGFRLGVIF
ncbi:uncharacterized protein BN659_01678 [Bacteroides sp. CAG:443]|nr:uncharacterized protein BN659_01678 [Bacteroides sp. CAG:443]